MLTGATLSERRTGVATEGPSLTDHLVFLSIPGLRTKDIDRIATPTLYEWASGGETAELTPPFPCVTSPVQASMMTGLPPGKHGVIANGFLDRDRSEIEFWIARNHVIAGEQVWNAIRKANPSHRSACWHLQNIKDAAADFIITPAPIHEPDGSMKLWCYDKPEGLYQSLIDELGHFPLQHYWGPMSNIESSKWILAAATWLVRQHAPNYHWIYIPHLDYASQKFGPDSERAQTALMDLDEQLAIFVDRTRHLPGASDAVFLIAGEYALTDVVGAIHPNRMLREAGLIALREEDGAEHIDLAGCDAFAMVDHQLAHVYVRDRDTATIGRCKEIFSKAEGIAGAYAGDERSEVGMKHDRAGDLVLISDDDRWFAYYWWLDDAKAPAFARTVDIHAKPGYDPVELFFDPKTKSIPLDAGLVKGSHGVPATGPGHRAALICSAASPAIREGKSHRDTDIMAITKSLLGL